MLLLSTCWSSISPAMVKNSALILYDSEWGSLLCTPLAVDLSLDWLVPWEPLCPLVDSKWHNVVIRGCWSDVGGGLIGLFVGPHSIEVCDGLNLGYDKHLFFDSVRWSMKIAERSSHKARLTELNMSDGTCLMNV